MKPGRELDAIVAEKVMGWKRPMWTVTTTKGDCMIPPGVNNQTSFRERDKIDGVVWTGQSDFEGDNEFIAWTPHYSTDIAAAWEVVNKLGNHYLITIRDGYGNARPGATTARAHYVSISGHGVSVAESGNSTPHAICLAALMAIEKRDEPA